MRVSRVLMLVAVLGLVMATVKPATATVNGYGFGRGLGRAITGGKGIGKAPQQPHRVVIDKSGRPRRQTLDPNKALSEIDRASSPEVLDRNISELVTYQDPVPLDLIGLAMRKRARLERPWWHPGRWMAPEEVPPATLLLPAVGGAALSVLRLLMMGRGLPPTF